MKVAGFGGRREGEACKWGNSDIDFTNISILKPGVEAGI